MLITAKRTQVTEPPDYGQRTPNLCLSPQIYSGALPTYSENITLNAGPALVLNQQRRTLTFQNTCIDLSGKGVTYRMIESFFLYQSTSLNKDQIIQHIYQPTPMALESIRHWEALCARLNKLIGRTRDLLYEHTGQQAPHLQWLTYDSHFKIWTLCHTLQ